MGLIKEPLAIDLNVKSTPWSEEELVDFRLLMKDLKAKQKRKVQRKVQLREVVTA